MTLNQQLIALTLKVAAFSGRVDALRQGAVELVDELEAIAARMKDEGHPDGAKIAAQMDGIRASLAKMTGAIQ